MTTAFVIIGVIILCFGLVVLVGAPYLPTHSKQVEIALDMLALPEGQTLLELGCGDGKVLVAAARRGLNVVGYELNPILVVVCLVRGWRYRRQIKVVWGNYWLKDWPAASGIFGFILPKYMNKLDKKVIQWYKGPVRLASFAFIIPHKQPVASREGVYLYEYS